MDNDVLEVVLKRCFNDAVIDNILEMESASALPKTENYITNIARIKIRVGLGNGRVVKRSFILKQLPQSNTLGGYIKNWNLFRTEMRMYTEVLREMAYMMEEIQDTQDLLWCNMIHYEPRTSLLFEDLAASGFRMMKRQQGLDLNHGLLVLHSLGRYHGMSKVLEERGIINKNDYLQQPPHFRQETTIKKIIHTGLKAMSKAIRLFWGEMWQNVAEKLEVPFEWLVDKFLEYEKLDGSTFAVLNHGDCWSKNIMFRYNWQNKPIAIKFLDFQAPYYYSPCGDITYFLYCGMAPDVRRNTYTALLQCYYDSLIMTLDKFGYTGSKPCLEDITKTMEHYSFYGLTLFSYGYPIITAESQTSFDLQKADGEESINENDFNKIELIEKMGPDLIDYVQKHLTS